jgi:uncharacterized membrane protein
MYKMKKVFLTIIAVVVAIGVLAGAGFAGYRFGFMQGIQTTSNGTAPSLSRDRMPQFHPGLFDRDFGRGVAPNYFSMMPYGRGFGFFSPLLFLGRIVFWVLVIWFVYWLFTRSGWRLSRTPKSAETATAEPSEVEKKME